MRLRTDDDRVVRASVSLYVRVFVCGGSRALCGWCYECVVHVGELLLVLLLCVCVYFRIVLGFVGARD